MNLAWFARCPTPYRYPIWREVAGRHVLQVFFLRDSGLGRSWRIEPADAFTQTVLRAGGPRYREDALWVLRPRWAREVPSVDVIVLQGMWETPAAWQIRWYAKSRRIPVVYFSESTLRSMHHTTGLISRMRSRFMRQCQAILTPGPEATRAVLENGVDPSRVVTSVNVVDVNRFHAASATLRNGSVAKPQDGQARHRFLVVARLVRLKFIDGVIEALGRLPDATLDIVGDGPERKRLELLAHTLGMSSRITFHGQLDEDGVIQHLATSQTLVLASTEEVWGLVVNEALAAGLHVVVSDRCGVARSVEGQLGVFLTEPELPQLVTAMESSRAAWRGWIETPEILTHDASRFVSDLEACVAIARRR